MNEHNIKAESEVVVEQEVVKNLNQLSVDFNHGRKELVADLLNQLQSNTHLSLLLQQNGLDRDTFLSKVQAIFDPEKVSIFELKVVMFPTCENPFLYSNSLRFLIFIATMSNNSKSSLLIYLI